MGRKRFSLELSEVLLNKIDQFKREWGLRSRGAIVERLLQELLSTEENEEFLSEEFDCEEIPGLQLSGEQNRAGGSVHLTSRGKEAQSNGANAETTIAKPPSTHGQISESVQAHAGRSTGQSASSKGQQTSFDGLEPSDFNERGALVLVSKGVGGSLALDFDSINTVGISAGVEASSKSGGIDLPGFVRKQSAQIKRSLTPKNENTDSHQEPLPTVQVEILSQAFNRAKDHWLELYGTAPNEAVLEASMVWLAKDIWPQCDQSERRLFTWSLACSVIEAFAPSWPSGGASFEKVIVMAGLLEDPFSTSTLQLRLPTLIRRFVHRFRTRKRGTSFQALEHTMTLHGALKLLQLPTSPGHRLTLVEIREAYRDIALRTHPDSGGSEDEMRKVNEAYQLLKELYRNG